MLAISFDADHWGTFWDMVQGVGTVGALGAAVVVFSKEAKARRADRERQAAADVQAMLNRLITDGLNQVLARDIGDDARRSAAVALSEDVGLAFQMAGRLGGVSKDLRDAVEAAIEAARSAGVETFNTGEADWTSVLNKVDAAASLLGEYINAR
jgi:hypothetical protein